MENVTNITGDERQDILNRARGLYDYSGDLAQQKAKDENINRAIQILFDRVAKLEQAIGQNNTQYERNLNIKGQAGSNSPIEDSIISTMQQAGNMPQGM